MSSDPILTGAVLLAAVIVHSIRQARAFRRVAPVARSWARGGSAR